MLTQRGLTGESDRHDVLRILLGPAALLGLALLRRRRHVPLRLARLRRHRPSSGRRGLASSTVLGSGRASFWFLSIR
jgi:hypothetical protein